jgi:formylglycine-generating enzyme required for sulfatase activity
VLRQKARLFVVLFAVHFVTGCAMDAELQPQVVLFIDTDVPVPSLADTLRIEVLEPDGSSSDARVYVRPNPSDWPVSMGIAPREDGAPTLLRLRLYEASHIAGRNPSELTEDLAFDDPLPAFVVDRLVEVAMPETGVRQSLVILHGDCMGFVADVDGMRTCVASGLDPRAAPSMGVMDLDAPPDPDAPPRPGTWDTAFARACAGEARTDSGLHDSEVCIPGGIFFLGDGRLGVNAAVGERWGSIPERLVRISPFFIDRHEVTVGRINAAIAEGFNLVPSEYVRQSQLRVCTFTPDIVMDDFPMNCITKELAEAFCAFDDGRSLPSEAQWEYAATSAGTESLYVWGDQPPTCDHAVFARIGRDLSPIFGIAYSPALGATGQCAPIGEGPERVGSTPIDTTEQGVSDMNGNVQEWTRDSFIALTHECWDRPFLRDPVCDIGEEAFIVKGGIWAGVLGSLPVALRKGSTSAASRGIEDGFGGHGTGFRCVRSGT